MQTNNGPHFRRVQMHFFFRNCLVSDSKCSMEFVQLSVAFNKTRAFRVLNWNCYSLQLHRMKLSFIIESAIYSPRLAIPFAGKCQMKTLELSEYGCAIVSTRSQRYRMNGKWDTLICNLVTAGKLKCLHVTTSSLSNQSWSM